MISINDKHRVEKPDPTYRIRDEAKAAAVAVLGPLAIHEFDFVTFQLDDGRWDWNVPGEERPLTAAIVKANGGKKFLAARAQQANLAITPKPHLSLIQNGNKGTPMAKTDKLPMPPRRKQETTSETSVPEASRMMANHENAPAAPITPLAAMPLSPAAEQLGRMGFTDMATWPSEGMPACNGLDVATDPLAIPGFLKREPITKGQSIGPEAMNAIKRMGNPAGAHRKAAGKPSAKAKVDSGEAEKRTSGRRKAMAGPSKGQSKTAMVGELLKRKAGCTAKDILDLTGWTSVSVPAQAKAVGLTLQKEKQDGVTRYWGTAI